MGSGRPHPRRHRESRAIILAASDICHLCGHGGARTADHLITAKDWPRGPDGKHLPGLDEPENMAPAHGSMGSGRNRVHNPCLECGGKLCNQSRGSKPLPVVVRSEDW